MPIVACAPLNLCTDMASIVDDEGMPGDRQAFKLDYINYFLLTLIFGLLCFIGARIASLASKKRALAEIEDRKRRTASVWNASQAKRARAGSRRAGQRRPVAAANVGKSAGQPVRTPWGWPRNGAARTSQASRPISRHGVSPDQADNLATFEAQLLVPDLEDEASPEDELSPRRNRQRGYVDLRHVKQPWGW